MAVYDRGIDPTNVSFFSEKRQSFCFIFYNDQTLRSRDDRGSNRPFSHDDDGELLCRSYGCVSHSSLDKEHELSPFSFCNDNTR